MKIRDLKGDPYGQYWPDERVIEIDRGHYRADPAEALLTLRHEMMEAALFLSGVGWSRRYDQEAVVRVMEQVFFPAWDRVLGRVG